MRNPKFDAHLETMRAIHDRKNADYAQDDNPYSNFETAAAIAGCSVDTVFAVLIGVKLARIRELSTGKAPNNESLADSRLDLSVYAALWASYHRSDDCGALPDRAVHVPEPTHGGGGED